jgi:hypothetical protein
MKFSILAGLVIGALSMSALAFDTDADGSNAPLGSKDSFLCNSKQPTKTCTKEGTLKMSNDQCQVSCRCDKDSKTGDKKVVCDKVADCSAKDVSHSSQI